MTTHTPIVELNLAGAWTNVTSYVRYQPGITVTHGQQNEGPGIEPCALQLTFDNTDGRFTPANPNGAYYGQIGRNTQIRVGVPYPHTAYLWVQDDEATKSSYASCPDSPGVSITGDIDVRVELLGKDWRVGGGTPQNLAAKYVRTGNERSWRFGFSVDTSGQGRLGFAWSTDGTSTNLTTANCTDVMTLAPGVAALRATLDVDNGAGGWTARFYTSDSITGTWTQLGSDVTGSGITSIFDSTAVLAVGDGPDINGGPVAGYYHKLELRNGIGGTVVANPDFTVQSRGAVSFTDGAGNTWTPATDAWIETYIRRFVGEISAMTPTRDISGANPTVAVEAAGISRRLQQGTALARSTMYRAHTSAAVSEIVAYWPMEDGQYATEIASGLPDGTPMGFTGTPTLASFSGWPASDPLPQAGTGVFTGAVPSYSSSGAAMVYLFVDVSSAVAATTTLLWVETTGAARYWQIQIDPSGDLITRAYDVDQTEISDGTGNLGTTVAFGMNSRGLCIIKLSLTDSGGNVNWVTSVNEFAVTDTVNTSFLSTVEISDTLTGESFGSIKRVVIGKDGGLGSISVGHAAVANSVDVWLSSVAKGIVAWNGEVPSDRISRLCTEENLGLIHVSAGQSGDITTLGQQLDQTILDLLQEASTSDGGRLYEPREIIGFAYRTRVGQYSRAAVLTLSCAANELAAALTPITDDQRTKNDITVSRVNGSSARATLTSGTLSTADPPDGVGTYDTSLDVSLETDAQLPDQANWLLHMGTSDEPRYGGLPIQLYAPDITTAQRALALAVDVGDRIDVTHPAADLPPDDIRQIVIGYTEHFDQFLHQIDWVTVPARPWQIAVRDSDRRNTAGSQLAADITSTATTLTVATTSGPAWTTDAADMPFDVTAGGERMTVSAISGTSSPQTFTVTRSVNGVTKIHSTGETVSLYTPVYRAL